MKKSLTFLIFFPLTLILVGCGRSAPNQAQSSKPSLGEALEASFYPSAQEKQARSEAKEQEQKLQSSQQQLQQERLKSYGDPSMGQNR